MSFLLFSTVLKALIGSVSNHMVMGSYEGGRTWVQSQDLIPHKVDRKRDVHVGTQTRKIPVRVLGG